MQMVLDGDLKSTKAARAPPRPSPLFPPRRCMGFKTDKLYNEDVYVFVHKIPPNKNEIDFSQRMRMTIYLTIV